MIQAFRTYLESYTTCVSDADLAAICAVFMPKMLKKKSFLLQAGQVCKHFAFVLKGALRMYSVDDKGGEHLLSFGVENWRVGERESSVMLRGARYYVDALEEWELPLRTYSQMHQVVRPGPAMAELMR